MGAAWSPLIGFEDEFNHTSAINFMRGHWHYSFYISLLYVTSIFGIQNFMRDRPKYNLRGPLMLWSLMLAAFSITGFLVTGLYHWPYVFMHGWKRGVCDELIVQRQSGLWSFLFCFSKAPELLDTYFIVLRKKKLIFLHWYHHVTVFIYCWYSYSYMTTPQQWFITMNYFVHSLMYGYYSIKASGFYQPPIWISMLITSMQLFQMVIGVWVNVYIFVNMTSDQTWYCDGKIETTYSYVYIAFVMYASYLLLFAHFFYTAYFSKKKSSKNGRDQKLKSNSEYEFHNGVVKTKVVLLNGTINQIGNHSIHLEHRNQKHLPL